VSINLFLFVELLKPNRRLAHPIEYCRPGGCSELVEKGRKQYEIHGDVEDCTGSHGFRGEAVS
jgi:hypothetical protein